MRQIVDDDVQPGASWVGSPHALECGQDITDRLPLVDCACQAIPVDIIKPQKLLGPLSSFVRSPEASWVPLAGPVLPVHWPKL
jgi:hypothetical protein